MRRVLRLIERSIDKHGQVLIVPELTREGWTTSLPASFDARNIIAPYADHGTHEQFHCEFKTDLDLTRLPSGKFDTHYLMCQLAALAMHILRLMGQRGLLGPDAPARHRAHAAAHQDGDAGADLPRRAPDRTWPTIDPRAGHQRPRGQGLRAAARRVVRSHGVHVAPPHPSPTPHGIRKIAPGARRGVGHARCARAFELIGALTSTENACASRVAARSPWGWRDSRSN